MYVTLVSNQMLICMRFKGVGIIIVYSGGDKMQHDEAQKLSREWGDKPCSHPEYDKEYYLGANTGDYVCTTCGRYLSEEERKKAHRV